MTEKHAAGERAGFEIAWYVAGYLRELVLIYPTYAIMMGEHGISPIELSALFVLWTATALVLDVPTGPLADRHSRKRLLVASNLVKGLAFVPWLVEPTFVGYALGFVLWGAGSSLGSGTLEAFLYDALRARGAEESFAKIYGRGIAANSFGVATALLAGGALAQHGYTVPLVLSVAAPCAAALVFAFAFDEPPREQPQAHARYADTLLAGLTAVRTDRSVAYLVAAFGALVSIYGTLEEYIGPYLKEKPSFDLATLGAVYAAAFASRSIGVAFAHRLPNLSASAIAWIFAASALPLAATTTGHVVWVAIAFALYFASSAAGEVLVQARLQAQIDGATRATVTSVARMAQSTGGIVLYMAFGGIAQARNWHAAVLATAAATLVLGIAFSLVRAGAAQATARA